LKGAYLSEQVGDQSVITIETVITGQLLGKHVMPSQGIFLNPGLWIEQPQTSEVFSRLMEKCLNL
jgi:hypothetical protein